MIFKQIGSCGGFALVPETRLSLFQELRDGRPGYLYRRHAGDMLIFCWGIMILVSILFFFRFYILVFCLFGAGCFLGAGGSLRFLAPGVFSVAEEAAAARDDFFVVVFFCCCCCCC